MAEASWVEEVCASCEYQQLGEAARLEIAFAAAMITAALDRGRTALRLSLAVAGSERSTTLASRAGGLRHGVDLPPHRRQSSRSSIAMIEDGDLTILLVAGRGLQ